MDRTIFQRRDPVRTLAAIESIVGLGAAYGGVGLLRDAEGLGAQRAWLRGSVFPDYTIPGLVLLGVIGGGMLATATLTLVAGRFASPLARAMGAVLLIWGVVETLTIGYVGRAQVVLLCVFVVVPGVALIAIAARCDRSLPTDRR